MLCLEPPAPECPPAQKHRQARASAGAARGWSCASTPSKPWWGQNLFPKERDATEAKRLVLCKLSQQNQREMDFKTQFS